MGWLPAEMVLAIGNPVLDALIVVVLLGVLARNIGRARRAIFRKFYRRLYSDLDDHALANAAHLELLRVGVGGDFRVQAWRNWREEPLVCFIYMKHVIWLTQSGVPFDDGPFGLPPNILPEAALAALPKRHRRAEPPLIVRFSWEGSAVKAMFRLAILGADEGSDAFFEAFPEFGYAPLEPGALSE